MSDDPMQDAAEGVPDGDAAAVDDAPIPDLDLSPETAARAAAGEGGAAGAAGEPHSFDVVLGIPVRLSVELGRAELVIRDVVNLGRGSILELDRNVGEAMDVRVNGILIGRGEIVVVNEERLGLRFTEVVSRAERLSKLG